jgi:hypothetical protein
MRLKGWQRERLGIGILKEQRAAGERETCSEFVRRERRLIKMGMIRWMERGDYKSKGMLWDWGKGGKGGKVTSAISEAKREAELEAREELKGLLMRTNEEVDDA